MSTITRCFTFGCTGIPEGTCWECPACKQRIHLASLAATRRAQQAKQLSGSVPPPLNGGSFLGAGA